MDRTRAVAVAGAFALGDPVGAPTFVARGAMGELWRVDVAGGRRWALKRLFEWAAHEPHPPDVGLQLAAHGAGIRLPRPRMAPDGRAIDDWYRFAPSTDELAELADRGDHAGRTWARGLRARLPQLRELADLVATSPMRTDDVVVCHWENAGPMSAESELAITIACWCTQSTEGALMDAYAAAGGPAAISGPASFAANAATELNYLRVLAQHSLDDDGHRAFAESQLAARLRVGFGAAVPRGWAS